MLGELAALGLFALTLLSVRRARLQAWLNAGFFCCFAVFAVLALAFLAAGLPPFLVRASGAFTDLLLGWQADGGLIGDLAHRFLGAASYDYLARVHPPSPTLPGTGEVVREYGFSLLNIGLAVVLLWLRRHDRTARLLAVGMLGTGAVFNRQAHAALAVAPDVFNPVHDGLHLLGGVAYLLAIALFPCGRLKPPWRELPRGRWPLRVAWLVLLPLVGFAFISDSHGGDAALYVMLFGVLIPVVGLTSQASRYRHAHTAEQRQQSQLFVTTMTAAIAGALTLALLFGLLAAVGDSPAAPTGDLGRFVFLYFPVLFAAIPVALFVILVRFRLWEIDRLFSRTWVYGGLAGFIGAVYVLVVVVGSHLVVGTEEPNIILAILATAIVAIAFDPLRRRLQRIADRLVYGRRASPYEVLAGFSGQVGETYDIVEVLPRMAQVIGDGTAATGVEVWLAVEGELVRAAAWPSPGGAEEGRLPLPVGQEDPGGEAAARHPDLPTIPGASEAVPVRHRGELFGVLAVSTPAGEPLPGDERRLLEDLAAQAGLVLRNVRLTAELRTRLDELSLQAAELRASRQRLVAAQDRERRRIERDIHDGAQQHLVALAVKLRLAARATGRDPEQAGALLADLRGETGDALESLRGLARGIYPTLLSDEGLVAALASHADRAPLPLRVEGAIGRYAEEVETAVYFCCLEAMQNAAKHAGAGEVCVRLDEHDGHLRFSVIDDGVGFDPQEQLQGRGLANLRDRIAALDGVLEVESAPGNGTAVRGRVPLPPRGEVAAVGAPLAVSR